MATAVGPARRMSAMDASFFNLERTGQLLHIAGVYTVEGALDFARLERELAERMHLLPRYTQRVVEVPFGLAHPTWDMGRVVTTNSATLVNKGLEVIEAHLLFGVPYSEIDVVVHPQSIVHSMVEFVDGSTIAQASPPDMRLPISLGLDWPNRVAAAGRPLDWTVATSWTFEPLDAAAFPAVALAKQVGRAGGEYPAVFNAANEEAVAAFHAGRIGFPDIVDTVRAVVESHEGTSGALTVASLAEAERAARRAANERIARTER